MKTQALASLASLMIAMIGSASARETTPAWQEPGYVMEEVVVTAPARPEGPSHALVHLIRYRHWLAEQSLEAGGGTGAVQAVSDQ